MKASKRREEIVRMATSQGLASVEDMTQVFGVTASTIRRDLAMLTESGSLARTYGGAIAVPQHRESPLSERSAESQVAKRAIGQWAARQVRQGDSVLLDAGTTTTELAHALRDKGPLSVTTIGLTPLAAISGAPDVVVICLGGHLRHISQGFEGPLTEAALEQLTFDAVFLGADGVTADRGICEATIAQTRLKELMWRASDKTYVLVHAQKLGTRPFNAWVRMPREWTLVTDDSATPEQLAPFRERGVTVVVIPAAGPQLVSPDAGDRSLLAEETP